MATKNVVKSDIRPEEGDKKVIDDGVCHREFTSYCVLICGDILSCNGNLSIEHSLNKKEMNIVYKELANRWMNEHDI